MDNRQTHIHVFHKTCGVIVEAAPDRWVLELHNLDPKELIGWREFKTESEALAYFDQYKPE